MPLDPVINKFGGYFRITFTFLFHTFNLTLVAQFSLERILFVYTTIKRCFLGVNYVHSHFKQWLHLFHSFILSSMVHCDPSTSRPSWLLVPGHEDQLAPGSGDNGCRMFPFLANDVILLLGGGGIFCEMLGEVNCATGTLKSLPQQRHIAIQLILWEYVPWALKCFAFYFTEMRCFVYVRSRRISLAL